MSCGSSPETRWNKNLRSHYKGPFGLYILHKEIKDLVRTDTVIRVNKHLYEFFDEKYDYKKEVYTSSGNYLYIHEYSTSIDRQAAEELLVWASHGNSVFISAKNFPLTLRDTLGFNVEWEYYSQDSLPMTLSLENKDFKKRKFNFSKGMEPSHFSELDPEKTTVLGKQKIGDSTMINFIRVQHVNGYFYLHTQPIAFTNYYLLKGDNYKYTENAFSYLPPEDIYWDDGIIRYNRKNRGGSGSRGGSNSSENDESLWTPLSFMFDQPALAWAFWLAVIGVILFIIFNAKRRQRIIAIIKPLENTTINFTKTIGNLYYQEQNHKSIVDKKITYFLEKIRNKYLLETDNLNSEFIEKLHHKSGKKLGEIKLLIQYIIRLNHAYECSEQDLIRLNELIEKFFKK